MTSLINRVRSGLVPTWLTGPIFDKELRVSSRRRRNYALRFVYLALLTIYVALMWITIMRFSRYPTAAYSIARMSEAGKQIIVSIIWFQFCVAQFVALIMLSNAVSDEIYHRTLGVLMTTPINSFQIVMGKLCSKLLQVVILLAISLPLLAVVRVLGGVSWDFVVASLCITLTAVLFVAALSMYFSIHSRRAYVVILKGLFAYGILFGLVPLLLFAAVEDSLSGRQEQEFLTFLFYGNPAGALVLATVKLLEPRAGGFSFSWPVHCLVMLGASAAILALCTRLVRKVALRQATGEAGLFISRRQRRRAAAAAAPQQKAKAAKRSVRSVRGSPIAWKELRTPMLRSRLKGILVAGGAAVALGITYALAADDHVLNDDETQMAYVLILTGIGALCTMVLSATSITSEKESRCWPILLATPLGDWHILLGKAAGVVRRCLPAWGLLAAHMILFTVIVDLMHPIVLLHVAMLVVALMALLTGTGLYFSARFRRTTTAVVMNIGLCLAIWLIIPALLGLTTLATESSVLEDTLVEVVSANPVALAMIAVDGAYVGPGQIAHLNSLAYYWVDATTTGAAAATMRMLLYMLAYIAAGACFAWRAKAAFRRNMF